MRLGFRRPGERVMFESANVNDLNHFVGQCLTRRQMMRAAALGLSGISAVNSCSGHGIAAPGPCGDDGAIDVAPAQLVPAQALLVAASGLRDARAVWCHVPENPDPAVLIYFHGHNG